MIHAAYGAFVIGPSDDVDHASDGVGTVDRRSAILQHFNTLDGDRRHRRNIGKSRSGNAQPAAVQQHERALRTEIAQADEGAPGDFAGGQRLRARQRRRAHRRDVLQDVGHRLVSLLFDVGAADREHRRRGFDIDLADTGAGHFNPPQILGFGFGFRCGIRFLCERMTGKRAGGQCDAQGLMQFAHAERGVHVLLLLGVLRFPPSRRFRAPDRERATFREHGRDQLATSRPHAMRQKPHRLAVSEVS